jgi:hypothetical protein
MDDDERARESLRSGGERVAKGHQRPRTDGGGSHGPGVNVGTEDTPPFVDGPLVTVSASVPRLLEDLFGWLGLTCLTAAAYLYVGPAGALTAAGTVALAAAVLLEVGR